MKQRRRPVRVEYTRTVYYGGGRRPPKKRWTWPLIAAGVIVVLILLKAPVLALLFIGGMWYAWRRHG
jgi:hypothetical protein